MTDKTSVCNQALALLGQGLLSDFDEDTKKGRDCRAFYNGAVLAVFEAFDWPFAKTRARLAIDSDYTELAGVNAFELPNKYARTIAPKGDGYKREGQHILAEQASLVLVYVQTVPEGLWPGSFEKCVTAYLASELAYKVTESNTKADQMFRLYLQRKSEAKQNITEVRVERESGDLEAARR